jgi:hypothetical protein
MKAGVHEVMPPEEYIPLLNKRQEAESSSCPDPQRGNLSRGHITSFPRSASPPKWVNLTDQRTSNEQQHGILGSR